MLKHAVEGGKFKGPILEVGPFDGSFLDFLHKMHPSIRPSVFGVEPAKMLTLHFNPGLEYRVADTTVEEFAESTPQMHGRSGIVVMNHVINDPSASPRTMLGAVAKLTRKGGKIFIQNRKDERMPTDDEFRGFGFNVIHSSTDDFFRTQLRVLEKR